MEQANARVVADRYFLDREKFPTLLQQLQQAGYRCIGPQRRQDTIVYDTLTEVMQLPVGMADDQSPGRYRLSESDSPRYFAWANGAQALKPWLFKPHETLWRVQRDDKGRLSFTESDESVPALAIFGVRACDLAALRLQDAHFLKQPHVDPGYQRRREKLFLVAVNCTRPASTCFCVSTGDGPEATAGYDLVLDELDEGFLLGVGSDAGDRIRRTLPLQKATATQIKLAAGEREQAARCQQRSLPSRDLRRPLLDKLNHPRWAEVAERCLSCANCTSVCPTCFCYSEHENMALSGDTSEHYRQWDSCFTQGHSYIHGVVIRPDTRTRYRQWLTHKLATWHDQYGRSGCVGCGRCVTWCPAGIDLTEEVAALSATDDDRLQPEPVR